MLSSITQIQTCLSQSSTLVEVKRPSLADHSPPMGLDVLALVKTSMGIFYSRGPDHWMSVIFWHLSVDMSLT